jgi:hypothetical protein
MPASLVNQVVDAYAVSAAFQVPNPTQQTRQISVSHTAGNWLIVHASWHHGPVPAGQPLPTVHVSDDAHNHWVPLVRHNSGTSGGGGCGAAIWAAPNPRKVSRVYLSPTGYVTGMAWNVAQIGLLGPHLTIADKKVAAAFGGTSLAVPALAAPPSEALALTCGASDDIVSFLSSSTAGWTSLTPIDATNGSTDYTGDIVLVPRVRTTTGSVSVAYQSAFTPCNLVGVACTILTTGIAPAQPNPNWPVLSFDAGFGSGQQTPRDSITWTDLRTRLLSANVSRGRNHELGALEAGTGDLRLRNQDGALNPENPSSPYYPNVTDMTPVRLLATWNGRVYPIHHAFFERLPQHWKDPHWGEVNATSIDAWATLTTELPNIVQGEILVDEPYAYWPLSDPAEAATASNLARNNSAPLVETLGKYGAGGATADFGEDPGFFVGSPSTSGWGQSGLTVLQNTNGYCLKYGPGGVPPLPSVAGGWTVELWARLDTAAQPQPTVTLIVARAGLSTIILFVDTVSGVLKVREYDPVTHASTDVSTSSSPIDGTWKHYTIRFGATGGWRCYVNAEQVATSASSLPGSITWVSFGGQADETFTGRCINGALAHIAIYPRQLPYGRIVAHYWAALSGTDNEAADWRINKLLAAAGWGGPRSISYVSGNNDGNVGPASAIEGRPVSSAVSEISESEGGGLYVDGAGYVCATSKIYRYNQQPAYVLGDRPDLGEIPYDGPGMTVDYDPAQVANAITVTQHHYGRVVQVEDAASRQQRGRLTLPRTTHLRNANQVEDTANYLLLRNKQPGARVATVTIDPASNPTLWPIALGAECGDIVTLNRRPLGAVLITGRYEVIGVKHDINLQDGTWKTVLSLAPADPFWFMLDDPVYGVLDGPGVLGW